MIRNIGAVNVIATVDSEQVSVSELDALDDLLNRMSDEAGDNRQEGDLIEFLTHISETLRQGESVTLYSPWARHHLEHA